MVNFDEFGSLRQLQNLYMALFSAAPDDLTPEMMARAIQSLFQELVTENSILSMQVDHFRLDNGWSEADLAANHSYIKGQFNMLMGHG